MHPLDVRVGLSTSSIGIAAARADCSGVMNPTVAIRCRITFRRCVAFSGLRSGS